MSETMGRHCADRKSKRERLLICYDDLKLAAVGIFDWLGTPIVRRLVDSGMNGGATSMASRKRRKSNGSPIGPSYVSSEFDVDISSTATM